jgi:hypothetical protein
VKTKRKRGKAGRALIVGSTMDHYYCKAESENQMAARVFFKIFLTLCEDVILLHKSCP